MSGVSGVGGPRNMSGIAMPEGVAMSPEAIIQMLMKEMGSIDGILDEMRERIQTSTARVRELNKLREIVRGSNGAIDISKLTPEQIDVLVASGQFSRAQLSEAYHALSTSNPELAEKLKSSMESNGLTLMSVKELPESLTDNRLDTVLLIKDHGDDEKMKKNIDSLLQSIQDRISQINSGQDMMMIQFQDMMSRRSNRINMATNLLKKINDAQDAVVANLR